MAEALKTSLPLALSSIAGPNKISMVIRALLQNEGGNTVALTPKSLAPAQSVTATIHSINIHRLDHRDKPIQTSAAIQPPIKVEPTNSRPAERALVEPAC